jgi:hypothetical protein
MKQKTPDQIRRATVPAKHYWLIYGLLGSFAGTALCFGGWGLTHIEQVTRYPQYCQVAFQSTVGSCSRFPAKRRKPGMSAAQLRYDLLRYGNEDHGYDAEIVQHGWYPRGESPAPWVYEHGAVKAIYSDGALLVWKWPVTLSLFTFLVSLVWGIVADYRYRSSIIAGVPLDGSLVATVDEYNAETRGDGMAYAVKSWKDR